MTTPCNIVETYNQKKFNQKKTSSFLLPMYLEQVVLEISFSFSLVQSVPSLYQFFIRFLQDLHILDIHGTGCGLMYGTFLIINIFHCL